MCFAVFSPRRDRPILLRFAHERVLLRRKGGFQIEADLLIESRCEEPISELRLLIPFPLVDTARMIGIQSEQRCERMIRRLRQKQVNQVRLRTSHLSEPNDPSNWIYNETLAHLDIDSRSEEGVFRLKRFHPETGIDMGAVKGFIKSQWVVQSPGELTDMAWGLQNVAQLSVIDLISRGPRQEHVQPGEGIWIRVAMEVPCPTLHEASVWRRVLELEREYRQEFRTPKLIAAEALRHVEQLKIDDRFTGDTKQAIRLARRNALAFLPREDLIPDVHDWRSFLFREPGLTITSHEATAVLAKEGPYDIRVPTRVLRSRRTRRYTAVEAFFGLDLQDGIDGDPRGSLVVKSKYRNPVQEYLNWINLLIGLIALALALLALR